MCASGRNGGMDPLRQQFVGNSAVILPWLEKQGITDLFINGLQSFFVEDSGKVAEQTPLFSSQKLLFEFVERLLVWEGKRWERSHPCVDGKLADGSRFHLVGPPVAPFGPLISIRRFSSRSDIGLDAFGDEGAIQWLREQMKKRRNLILCGGTGCGKTTLLSRLLDELDSTERIAILEETPEIQTEHAHTVRLEGGGELLSMQDLVRNVLRMRPDRILIGESRGPEAFDILHAMNSGHPGSLTTLHSNGARDGLRRFEALAYMGGHGIPLRVIREWIAQNIHGIVFLERHLSHRYIKEILEVRGLEGEVYRLHPHRVNWTPKALASLGDL